MRKYALINDYIVSEVRQLSDECVSEISRQYQLVVDVEDLIVTPMAGWVVSGNQIAPPAAQSVPVQDMIKGMIRKLQQQAPELLVNLYVSNTLLGITTSQSDQMFSDYEDVLVRIREGAWPTALYRLNQKTPAGFVTQQMIDNWKAMIIAGMQP